jgi:hypothetical protein
LAKVEQLRNAAGVRHINGIRQELIEALEDAEEMALR